MSDFGLERSFEKATAALKEHYGFSVPVSTTARITLEHADKIAAELHDRDNASKLPNQGADCIIAEADGSFVPIVTSTGKYSDRRKNRKTQYKEARLCACQAKDSSQVFYESSFEDVDAIGTLWKQCAKQAGRGLNTRIHCLGDGAPWIQKQAQQNLSPQRYLVDFYHVCEYLSAAEPSCSGKARWFTTQKNRLRSNRVERVLADLEPFLEGSKEDETSTPVLSAHRYLSNRLDQLDYAGSLAEGLPIGSGLIESGHKHVIQARLKIPGASWNEENAQIIAQARTLRANEQWDEYWSKN